MRIRLQNGHSCDIIEFFESEVVKRDYAKVIGMSEPLESAMYRFYQIVVNCDLGNPEGATLTLPGKDVRLIHLEQIYVNPEKSHFVYDCLSDFEVAKA